MDPDFRQYRFEANMPLEQHRHFNNILNETVKRTQGRDYKVKPKSFVVSIQDLSFFLGLGRTCKVQAHN